MKKVIFPFILLFLSFKFFPQNNDSYIDSLEKVARNSKNPKDVIYANAQLVRSYANVGKKEKSLALYAKTLADAGRLNDVSGLGVLYNSYACVFYNASQYDSALYYFEKSAVYREKANDSIGVVTALNNIGSIYYSLGEYKKGLEFLEKAIRKEVDLHIKEGTYTSLNNIGYIYTALKLYRKSFTYFKKAEIIGKETNDIQSLVFSYDGMATAYQNLNLPDSSLVYAKKSLEMAEKVNDAYSIAYSLNSIGILYNDKKDYLQAKEYFEKALVANKKINDQRLELSVYGNLAQAMVGCNKPDEANAYIEKVIELERKFNIKTDKLAISELLANYFFSKRDFEKAFLYLKDFGKYRDSIYSSDITNQISELQSKYDVERKERENQLLQRDNELKNVEIAGHKTTRNYLVGIIVLFVIVIFGAWYFYQKIKAYSTLLGMQKNSIEQKNHLLEEQKKEITDSINYAKRIQYSLLAHDDLLLSNIPDHFVMFKPKDIVSGDFYWAATHEDKFYLAVCDSTGHGVPGAFMSLLNIGFLNEAIKEKNITEPNLVFNYVRKRLVESISRDNQKDGMDGILVCIDKKNNTISYAAAHNAPVLISNGLLLELEKDKMPVGKGENEHDFKLFTINYKKDDILYLYTDGYADQFGGDKGKKFKYKPLNDLLLSIHNKPRAEQGLILESTFNNWKGNLEQIDDVCVIGIKI